MRALFESINQCCGQGRLAVNAANRTAFAAVPPATFFAEDGSFCHDLATVRARVTNNVLAFALAPQALGGGLRRALCPYPFVFEFERHCMGFGTTEDPAATPLE